MTEEPGEYRVGDGRYVIAVNKRAAHILVFLLLVASMVYWADATGLYHVFGKTEGIE